MNECCKQIEDSARRQLEIISDEKEALLRLYTGLMRQEKDYESRLRDEFAMAALHGIIAADGVCGQGSSFIIDAQKAYRYADAMIEARRK